MVTCFCFIFCHNKNIFNQFRGGHQQLFYLAVWFFCSAQLNVGLVYEPEASSAWPTTSAAFHWRAAGTSVLPTLRSATTGPVRAALSGSVAPGVRYGDVDSAKDLFIVTLLKQCGSHGYLRSISVFCRVWSRPPAEVRGVSDENRRRVYHYATLWVLLAGTTPQSAELQPELLWSKVVPHWLEWCEFDWDLF